MSSYPNLFKPIKINGLLLKNRIIAAPMGGGFIDKHKMEDLAARARGGAALVILGSCQIDNDRSFIARGWAGLFEPFMEMYMDQLNVIHQYGAKASLELMHAGLWADVEHLGKHPLGPVSMNRDIGKDADGLPVDGMSEQDMRTVAASFAQTAARAQKFGFDMVMLHFAHGWLPAQFLSPKFNKRTDEYGGSFENRIRFPTMIVEAVRQAVGPNFPVDMRISGDERCADGIDPEDVIRFVQSIQDKIDMVHVSSGIDKYLDLTTYVESPSLYPHMLNVHLAAAMKKAVRIPVTTVGAITTPEEAESILAAGQADFVAMARPLLTDPQWPEKARTGRAREIVPCLRCTSCYHVATEGFTHGCAVNPVFTRAERLRLDRLQPVNPKKIVIIGGGAAGLKASLTAVEYGHQVTLLEKTGELGGLIKVTEYEDRKIDLRNYKRYLAERVLNAGFEIRLNCEATPDFVKSLMPDVIIVAVGSEPLVPTIPGIERPIVIQALDAYQDLAQVGQRVVIIGGGEIGCELGLNLAETGHTTTIVEMTDRLAPAGNLLYREGLQILMNQLPNLTGLVKTRCLEIRDNGILVMDDAGRERMIEADTVVLATGMKARRDVAESFEGLAEEVFTIGDCVRPRKIDDATYEGFFAITTLSRP